MSELDKQPANPTAAKPILVYEYPGVSLLVFLSLVGCLLGTSDHSLFSALTFGRPQEGEYWRLITPMFLHFGITHLVFNMFWLAFLGSKIERQGGSIHLCVLVLVVGIASNLGQYLWTGLTHFGGMSGVIYGLLGYLWMCYKLTPKEVYFIPAELFWCMIGWLLLCATGFIEILLGMGIANAAHVFGLSVGIILGFIFGLLEGRTNLKGLF